MKFGSLYLRAYGPFTNTVLDLNKGGAGLQIVLGPNEAGKSTALRAVEAFFFGIHGQTTDNFVHDYPDMRVGAVLIGEDDKRHALMRRKGNKNVLFPFDETNGEERTDTPIPPERLSELLLGVDEDLFRMLFGLSHEALRRGGQSLLQGEGNLGNTLFEAGAGLGDVKDILQSLEDESRALFLPSGKNQAINNALLNYETNRKTVRETAVRPQAWKELDGSLQEALAQTDQLETDQRTYLVDLARKRRLRDLRPIAVNRQNLLRILEDLRDAARLPQSTRDEVTAIRERVAAAQEQIAEAKDRIKAHQAALDPVIVSGPHLEAATDIEALHHAATRAREEFQRLFTLSATLTQKQHDVLRLSRDLTPDAEPGLAESLVPSSAISTRLKALARQLDNVAASKTATVAIGDKARDKLSLARESLAAVTAPGDVSSLQAALENLQRQGDLERTLNTLAAKVKEIGDEVKRLCAALEHPDQAKLFSLPRPQRTSVEEFKKRLQGLEETAARLRTEQGKLESDLSKRKTEIRLLEAAGTVVTGASLEGVRKHRDKIWGGIRQVYFERTKPIEQVRDELAIQRELPEEFERNLRLADDQADLLRADTARATKYADLDKRIEDMRRDLERIEQDKEQLAAERQAWASDWARMLQPLELAERSPDALVEWLRDYDRAASRAGERDKAAGEQHAVSAAIEQGRTVLEAAYGQASLSFPKLPTLSSLLDHARTQLKLAQDRANEIASLEKDKAEAQRQIAASDTEFGKLEARWISLMDGAASDLKAIGLPSTVSSEEIEARLERLSELAASLQAIQQTKASIDAAQGVWNAFIRPMQFLVKRLSAAEPERTEDYLSFAGTFYTQLDEARKAQSRRQGLETAIASDNEILVTETAKEKSGSGRLTALVELAQCEDVSRLDDAISASEKRRKAELDLETIESGLRDYSQGEIQALLEAAALVNSETLQVEISQLEAALSSLEPKIKAAQAAAAQAKADLDHISGSALAIIAKENMEHCAAAMQRDSTDYARTRLAHALLSRAIQTYQQRSQGPFVKRASEWFSRITERRYKRLVVDYELDRQVLLAERPDGQRLGMNALSEGTADQLYLALRLAAIEGRLETAHGVPLILDDALLAFDDQRAGAALRALADFSQRNQVILFTHHGHIVDLARKNLKQEQFSNHELNMSPLAAGA